MVNKAMQGELEAIDIRDNGMKGQDVCTEGYKEPEKAISRLDKPGNQGQINRSISAR